MIKLDAKWSLIGKLSDLMFANKTSNWQCLSVAISSGVAIQYGIFEGAGLIVLLSLSEVFLRRFTAQKRINYCMYKLNEICGKDKRWP